MAVMDKQFFIDMAAVLIFPTFVDRGAPHNMPDAATRAYDYAEVLWREREKRYQTPEAAPSEPDTTPTRVGPEF